MPSPGNDPDPADDLPPVRPVMGHPAQKRTLFDKVVVTAGILRQSR